MFKKITLFVRADRGCLSEYSVIFYGMLKNVLLSLFFFWLEKCENIFECANRLYCIVDCIVD